MAPRKQGRGDTIPDLDGFTLILSHPLDQPYSDASKVHRYPELTLTQMGSDAKQILKLQVISEEKRVLTLAVFEYCGEASLG